jgi:mono/diheme cytochrome c family protein
MSMRIVACLAFVVLASAPRHGSAQGPGQGPAEGRELALRLCSNRHATDPGGVDLARADVPSFRAIAKSPRSTPERLAGSIRMPHPEMPGVPLTRAEIRAIVEYIVSSRRPP